MVSATLTWMVVVNTGFSSFLTRAAAMLVANLRRGGWQTGVLPFISSAWY